MQKVKSKAKCAADHSSYSKARLHHAVPPHVRALSTRAPVNKQ